MRDRLIYRLYVYILYIYIYVYVYIFYAYIMFAHIIFVTSLIPKSIPFKEAKVCLVLAVMIFALIP